MTHTDTTTIFTAMNFNNINIATSISTITVMVATANKADLNVGTLLHPPQFDNDKSQWKIVNQVRNLNNNVKYCNANSTSGDVMYITFSTGTEKSLQALRPIVLLEYEFKGY